MNLPPAAPKWPQRDEAKIRDVVSQGYGLADLWEVSPMRIEDNDQHVEHIIDQLFPGNPLLCCGWSQDRFDTRPREDWRGELAAMQFIVPSPMSALKGITQGGRESAHCLANTGDRRFLVCEFDEGTPDEQSGILLHLAQFAPMVCALSSGGRSLHGFFLVAGHSMEKVSRFFHYAVTLGADPATWTRSQFVRMPDGTRDNGRRQTVFFLNFRPLYVHLSR